jgi:endopeptidase La
METLTLKELLVSGNEDIYKKQISIQNDVNMVMNHKIDILLKKFADMELFNQRNVLINLLIYNKNDEIQYITYLLYDLITINSSQETTDSLEQQMIFDSFPWRIKLYFKEAMKSTLKYTQDMIKKYDTNSITFEQKIFLLKASENVKEKAMTKFKELKGKSDESGAKAKQYLEGLLKIPFGIYKKEPILKTIHIINESFLKLINKCGALQPPQSRYTTIEMMKYITGRLKNMESEIQTTIETNRNKITLKDVTSASVYINQYLEQQKQKEKKIKGKNKNEKLENILDYMKEDNGQAVSIKCKIHDLLLPHSNHASVILHDCETIKSSIENINVEMANAMNVLDQSIYGHMHAKNQILKIIGQWMNGEQTGYCFGFEGSPGIGKTSLAKNGLSGCLKDENGASRPFAFIALGGSSNGSTLEGHSYTYVNSIWGRIVDILMETKCMNPIIYIDELDKVSKTENGKEIIGILTHIIDSTQNDSFQDKYFSGIDIDLSKILFIFSYNDASQIDKILLDRIHRIRFDNLSLEDKLVVVKNYILPSIGKKMGLSANSVNLSDSMVEYIIETYTMEPGIRKLKEILFDLYGEINLDILRCTSYENAVFPIEITKEILEKYLEKYDVIKERIIQKTSAPPMPGIINGLWANVLGKGGILPIEVAFFPSAHFLELKLTGQLGDVMKESMNVAKSLAWSLTPDEKKEEWLKKFEKTKNVGIHVHCPEGAVSKDGPSAGVAITCAIYSLLNNRPIPSKIAITGEIDLRGNVTAIGGLDMKILGGIRAGVKTFFFPESNGPDFQKIKKKYVESGKWTTLSEKTVGATNILIEKMGIQKEEIEFIQAKDIKGVLEIIYNNII